MQSPVNINQNHIFWWENNNVFLIKEKSHLVGCRNLPLVACAPCSAASALWGCRPGCPQPKLPWAWEPFTWPTSLFCAQTATGRAPTSLSGTGGSALHQMHSSRKVGCGVRWDWGVQFSGLCVMSWLDSRYWGHQPDIGARKQHIIFVCCHNLNKVLKST